MEELARAAGVSRATLFRRYPSRAELVADLSRRALDAYVRDVDRVEPERGPATEALRRVLAHLVALAPRYGLLALQPLEEVVEHRLLEQVRSAEDRLRALVRRGQEAGEFRVDLARTGPSSRSPGSSSEPRMACAPAAWRRPTPSGW